MRGAGAYISEIERRVLQGRVRKGLADDILVGRALSVQNGASIHDVLTVMPPYNVSKVAFIAEVEISTHWNCSLQVVRTILGDGTQNSPDPCSCAAASHQ